MTTKTFDVATFGEAMMLLIADRPGPLENAEFFTKRIAGAEINVATGMARLGFNTHWASRLGADSMARYLIKQMKSEGVHCEHVVLDPAQKTGFQIKGRSDDGSDPQVEYHRKGAGWKGVIPRTRDEVCDIIEASRAGKGRVTVATPQDNVYNIYRIEKP